MKRFRAIIGVGESDTYSVLFYDAVDLREAEEQALDDVNHVAGQRLTRVEEVKE